MQRKGTIIGSIIGLFGLIGYFSDVIDGAKAVFHFKDYIFISWDIVFILCISVGVVIFLWLLYALALKVIKWIKESKSEPSISYHDALNYIEYNSQLGKSFGENKRTDAAHYLCSLILKKEISVWGVDKDKKLYELNEIIITTEPKLQFLTYGYKYNERNDLGIIIDGKTYSGIQFDKKALHKLAPVSWKY